MYNWYSDDPVLIFILNIYFVFSGTEREPMFLLENHQYNVKKVWKCRLLKIPCIKHIFIYRNIMFKLPDIRVDLDG